MIGWIGVGLLVVAYIVLHFTEHPRWFYLIDTIASFILTIHAITLVDWPFIIVNAFITLVLGNKVYKEFR